MTYFTYLNYFGCFNRELCRLSVFVILPITLASCNSSQRDLNPPKENGSGGSSGGSTASTPPTVSCTGVSVTCPGNLDDYYCAANFDRTLVGSDPVICSALAALEYDSGQIFWVSGGGFVSGPSATATVNATVYTDALNPGPSSGTLSATVTLTCSYESTGASSITTCTGSITITP